MRRAEVAQNVPLVFPQRREFHEAVTHEIANTLVKLLKPKYLRICGDFGVRGGIHTVVRVSHGAVPANLRFEPDPETAELARTPGFT